VRALGESPAVLIGSHGVVAVGPDCEAALAVAEVVEQTAHVVWLLRDRRAESKPTKFAPWRNVA
jgi:ribulose-5-phosphate 4-epimerase/fuculose-1-phosphate aldolase